MPKKALVVDNDFFFVEFLSEILEKRGYHVIKAADGKEGINKLETDLFDMVFLEIIMPKVDGKQLVQFIHKKFPQKPFPIIIVSGYLVEQMDDLDEIGADYYIAKGTMEEMGDHVDGFLDKIEETPHPDPKDKIFLEPGQVYPRRSTAELMDILNYQKAITESTGIGLIVVDTDGKIIQANPASLGILEESLEDVLNLSITNLFPAEHKEILVNSLKRVFHEGGPDKICFAANHDSKELQLTVSALNVHDKKAGWVLTLGLAQG